MSVLRPGKTNAKGADLPDRLRVVVVDDHPAICHVLADVVGSERDFEVCGTALSAEQALELVSENRPELATIDIALPDGDGVDLVKTLRAQFPDLGMVVYSMYDESIYAERVIRAGAQGYVMKDQPSSAVIAALRTVARGDVYLSKRIASQILVRLASRDGTKSSSTLESLTDREMTVFQMLGRGHNVTEIAAKLSLSAKTVETYRRRAKEKLGCDSIAQLLQYAVRWTCGHSSPGSISLEGTRNGKL